MKRWSVKKKMVLIVLLGVLLAGISYLAGGSRSVKKLLRNSYDGEAKTEELLVTVDGVLEKEEMELEVHARHYSQSEIREAFDAVMDCLDTLVLGENSGFDRIESDLSLVKKVEGYPISITWELDSYDILDTSGKLLSEDIPESGVMVEIRGILSYDEQEAIYIRKVNVFPRKQSEKEAALLRLKEEITKQDEESKEIESLSLPETLDGKKVTWEYPADDTPLILLLLSVVVAVFMPALKKQKDREAEKEKCEQMLCDYPKIMNDIALLLDTGMTIRQVLERMVRRYEKQEEKRYAYEELKETFYEMQSGVSEMEAYERFGERCNLAPYRKLAALLSQNLMKGTRGLASLLQMEAIQADEDRKAQGRKRAEEAGTKLLIPMFVMLGVVMAVVIFPAFLSMNV